MRAAAGGGQGGGGLYIPCGALWGARDLARLADRGQLHALTITMTKAPHHLKARALAANDSRRPVETTSRLLLSSAVRDGPIRHRHFFEPTGPPAHPHAHGSRWRAG